MTTEIETSKPISLQTVRRYLLMIKGYIGNKRSLLRDSGWVTLRGGTSPFP